MMATLAEPPPSYIFDPHRYLELVNDRSEQWHLPDVEAALAHGYAAVLKWRRRAEHEGGYGPLGLPEPDGFDPPVNALPRPWWYPGTIHRWALQVGKLTPDGVGQIPKQPGRGPV